MMKQPLNLILPAYRPSSSWAEGAAKHLAALQQSCHEAGIPLAVYLVNDGSEEDKYFPESVLNTLRGTVEHFHFLSYFPNHGKGYSLRYGVSHAGRGFLIYTDCDFPFGCSSILSAYQMLEAGAEVVMGKRDNVYSNRLSPFRRFLSVGLRRVNSLLFGFPLDRVDTQSGLKGFSGRGRLAFLMTQVDTFLFDTEFILIAQRNQLNIAIVPLKLREGLHFSRMGFKVIVRELIALAGVFFRCRIGSRVIRQMEKAVEQERCRNFTEV
jgi:hypothetical protein